MKNVATIFRRDLAAYFTSPIGYLFIIVFLLISVGLYITTFFTFPVADMRGYFTNLPILLCVFIPAMTMRVWAEERKENTWEMLLTFPMGARELVLGKFLACLVFLTVTLAATITVPIMLAVLGDPDTGAIIGGYLGTLLLGAFFLAIGIFFSGFCKDQIVAFVVTLLACFMLFLLGTNFIASYIDGVFPGLGSLLTQIVGIVDHYNPFTRGVIEMADVLYFLVWTVLFLVLNMMFIDGRHRPGARTTFGTAAALCVGIGLAFNWLLIGQSLGRFDLTEDKIYTVSDASKAILSRLDDPVQVKIYITPKNKMPTGLTSLGQDIVDKLEELRVASGGAIQHTTIHLEAANVLASADAGFATEDEDDEDKAIEKRMLDKGVTPFSVQAIDQDTVTNKLIYSSIGIGYRDKTEEIIPQVVPNVLPELEYRLVSTIYKLTREDEPVVALVAPKEAINLPPQQVQFLRQLGQEIPAMSDPYVLLERILRYEKYDVRRVELNQNSRLPEEYDTLVVVNPRSLNDRQRWEINRALVSGKSVVMAVQNYEWDYTATREGIRLFQRDENPQVNELLDYFGLGVDRDILMDVNHIPLTISSGANPLAAALGLGQPVDLPTHLYVTSSTMDHEMSITSRLSTLFYLWGSALAIDEDELKKHDLDAKVLMSTSDGAWKVAAGTEGRLTQADIAQPETGTKRYPLMVMVTGQFPDAYKDEPRPAWPPPLPAPGQPPLPPPPEEGEPEPAEPEPGKLILLGCSEMFRENFLRGFPANLDLFMNAVDGVTLTDEIVHIRGRKPVDRTISMPSPATRRFWKMVNYALMNILVAAVGITTAVLRRRARNAYTMAFAGREES